MNRHLAIATILLATAAPLVAAPQASGGKAGSALRATHLLTLSLVLAGNEGAAGSQTLSAATAKAIQDIKDFLPYSRYDQVDTAVLRTSNLNFSRAELQGPDGRYVARFQYTLEEGGRKLHFSKFELARVTEAFPSPGRKTGEDDDATPKQPSHSREVISTSFSLDEGETIVVGTSRLNGSGKAVVLVLTALPQR
ncbi:MAG TPA: hypothetical protein VJV23_15415 [Candidatus Polarisedimenticolia bacterium]|nr:hypothetical protein [Candidatus Polarisedimenticolia bacterium]